VSPEFLRQKVIEARAEVSRIEGTFLLACGWECNRERPGLVRWRDTEKRPWTPQGVAVAIAMATLDAG
jgi:hypothetical protein